MITIDVQVVIVGLSVKVLQVKVNDLGAFMFQDDIETNVLVVRVSIRKTRARPKTRVPIHSIHTG